MAKYIHRDVSWLSFNYRVLQEAKDPSVPLLEKLKFLAIYSSNLDEFFRIRVANHRNLARADKSTLKNIDYSPEIVLREILNIANNPSDLIISFLSGATQNWGDEGFGIDNIMITGDPSNVVPLPAALPLFAAGLGAMGFLGWRSKRRAPT